MSFHYLHFRTFAQATEDEERVKTALHNLAGEGEVRRTETSGSFGDALVILEMRLTAKRAIKEFWARAKAAGQVATVLNELEERMDDEGNLYASFMKQSAFEGEVRLGKEGGVISMRGKVAAYPATAENALEAARNMLSSL